jgi:tetrahydromethanopterin S-methyltransferase subunit D
MATTTTTNPPSNHFRLWLSLAIFSAVSLVSTTNFLGHKKDVIEGYDHSDWTRHQRAVVSVATISLALSVLGCIIHMVNRDNFSGTNFEFGLVRRLCS